MVRRSVPILGFINPRTSDRLIGKLVARGECLEFSGTRNSRGYGFVDVMRKGVRFPILAHRLAWARANGRDPDAGLLVLHRCNNPSCCRAEHLYLGTPADNARDMLAAGRESRAMLGVKGVDHPASRYSKEQKAQAIAMMVRDGKSRRLVGFELKINPQTISRWWNEWEALCGEVGREKAAKRWGIDTLVSVT